MNSKFFLQLVMNCSAAEEDADHVSMGALVEAVVDDVVVDLKSQLRRQCTQRVRLQNGHIVCVLTLRLVQISVQWPARLKHGFGKPSNEFNDTWLSDGVEEYRK